MADKKTRIKIEDFLPMYLEAVADGLTQEEFADRIGVEPLTVYQRVNKLRKDPRMASLPQLKGESNRVAVNDKAAAIFAQFADTANKAG